MESKGISEDEREDKESEASVLSRDGTVLVKGVLGPEGRKHASKVAKQQKILDRKAAAAYRMNGCLAVAFFANTAVSMYVGIKV